MASRNSQTFPPDYVWAPGTVVLRDRDVSKINLFPVPTSTPDDPLNWTALRKFINYGIVCSFVLWTFVQLDVGFTAWSPMMEQLNMSVFILNAGAAVNYGGLAIGCFFFMPFVHKYGRRPLYVFSAAVQLASCVWQARVQTDFDLIAANILSGLGGAICETVVQITIADIFFVQQHATMNSWYLIFTAIGAFLGPVASGYVADSQGWRWMWWWCVIFMGIQFVAIVFLYEESKFVPDPTAVTLPPRQGENDGKQLLVGVDVAAIESQTTHNITSCTIDPDIPYKTYRQRMALVTPTSAPILQHFYQPFVILFTFPAVLYTAITFGTILACFAIITSVEATYLIEEPYNFSPSGVGLMNLPPFIGCFIGFFVGGWLNDKSIMWLANRNGGIYEPEMRLWMAIPASFFVPAGLLMFGIGLAHGVAWIVLAIACAIFGFGFIVCLDIALAYCTDCYQDIVGDALVGVVFSRNVISLIILFVLTAWIDGMGVQNLHILTACVTLVILNIPAVLLWKGKQARLWTQERYRAMAMKQPTHRTF